MTKKDIIFQIRYVYTAHIKWRLAAKSMHLGLPMLEKKVEKNSKLTEFGRWYYNQETQVLSQYESFQKLEVFNNRIHHIYENIILISDKKFDDELQKVQQILAYFRDLEKQSKELLSTLKELESEIIRMEKIEF